MATLLRSCHKNDITSMSARAASEMSESHDKQVMQFHEMELDDRILKAIASLGWSTPTLIQEKAIPLILEGKDVLVRARTGSGKTAAFVIPIVQSILKGKQSAQRQAVKALLLAPSKELCAQICSVIKQLTAKCSLDVRCCNIAANVDLLAQKPMLIEQPDIVVSTPARALMHLKAEHLRHVKDTLQTLVIDEADLLFSFGYEADVMQLFPFLPSIHQSILASATLSDDVSALKQSLLHNPVVLQLQEPALAPTTQLSHYHLMAEELDKVTILYALLKLHLIRGKTIVFVNTVDRCYKIKLYLEQFGIQTCVLNSELPASIRCQSVQQFNEGVYDIIVASDEKAMDAWTPVEAHRKRRKDRESGVSRGIDFQCVSNIVNLDFPLDVASYVHRAGRTARGTNTGSVLSFVNIREAQRFAAVEEHLQTMHAHHRPDGLEPIVKTYEFRVEEIEAFKYRAQDAWRAVTRIAVREARLKEIKAEIFNSKELKSYFEDNPTDLKVLRHDKALHTVRHQQHLRNVPDYIVPPTLKNMAAFARKPARNSNDHFKRHVPQAARFERKRRNPLQSMSFDAQQK